MYECVASVSRQGFLRVLSVCVFGVFMACLFGVGGRGLHCVRACVCARACVLYVCEFYFCVDG